MYAAIFGMETPPGYAGAVPEPTDEMPEGGSMPSPPPSSLSRGQKELVGNDARLGLQRQAPEGSPHSDASWPKFKSRMPDGEAMADSSSPAADAASSSYAGPSNQLLARAGHAAVEWRASTLKERAEAMFLADGDGPRASGRQAAALTVTYGLIIDVDAAARELWRERSEEIRQRCAPSMPKGLIALQEVVGFLVADALGRPILPFDAALAVGQQADTALRAATCTRSERKGKLVKAKEAKEAAVRKAKRAAELDPSKLLYVAAAETAGDKAIASVLATEVSLRLPSATVGKRRREAEPPPTVPPAAPPTAATAPPTLNELQREFDMAESAVTFCVRRVDRAEHQLKSLEERGSEERQTVSSQIDAEHRTLFWKDYEAWSRLVDERHTALDTPYIRAAAELEAARKDLWETKREKDTALLALHDACTAVRRPECGMPCTQRMLHCALRLTGPQVVRIEA
jgi:hypothetical protein